MYIFLEARKNIKGIKLLNSDIIIKNRENDLYAFYNNRLICNDVSDFFTFKNYIIYNKKSSCFIYNIGTNISKCEEYRNALNLNSTESNSWLFIDTASNLLLFENNFDLDNEKLLIEKYDWEFLFLSKCKLFLNNKSILKSLSLLTGEYEWELDLRGRIYLSDIGEEVESNINQIIGIWEDYLLVCLDCNYVAIDINTGRKVWETLDFENENLKDIRSYKRGRPFLNVHIENGKLYNFTGSIYFSFDIKTQAFELLWHDSMVQDFLNIKHATYTEEYIYFTASYNQNISPTVLGVFNRKTFTVDWLHEPTLAIDPKLGYTASLNQAPQVSVDKIYALDSGGTLHIFEKENDA